MNTIAEIYGLRYKDSGLYFYVGSSIHVDRRLKEHFKDAINKNYNKRLTNRLLNRKDDVVMDILDAVFDGEDRYKIEKFWLDTIKNAKHPTVNAVDPTFHYTIHPQIGKPSWITGKKHTEESKAKMREARKHKVFSDDERKKSSLSKMGNKNPMYGKIGTRTGCIVSEGSRDKIALANCKSGVTQKMVLSWLLEDANRSKLYPKDVAQVFPKASRSIIVRALKKSREICLARAAFCAPLTIVGGVIVTPTDFSEMMLQ